MVRERDERLRAEGRGNSPASRSQELLRRRDAERRCDSGHGTVQWLTAEGDFRGVERRVFGRHMASRAGTNWAPSMLTVVGSTVDIEIRDIHDAAVIANVKRSVREGVGHLAGKW